MIMLKSQFVQHVFAAITLAFVLGVLSMIWSAIIALFLGLLLLLQSFGAPVFRWFCPDDSREASRPEDINAQAETC